MFLLQIAGTKSKIDIMPSNTGANFSDAAVVDVFKALIFRKRLFEIRTVVVPAVTVAFKRSAVNNMAYFEV